MALLQLRGPSWSLSNNTSHNNPHTPTQKRPFQVVCKMATNSIDTHTLSLSVCVCVCVLSANLLSASWSPRRREEFALSENGGPLWSHWYLRTCDNLPTTPLLLSRGDQFVDTSLNQSQRPPPDKTDTHTKQGILAVVRWKRLNAAQHSTN